MENSSKVGLGIAAIGVALGGYVIYKAFSNKETIPGEIIGGDNIGLEFVWTNKGEFPLAPDFRLDIERDGGLFGSIRWSPIEGQWHSAPELLPGLTSNKIQIAANPIPGDWSEIGIILKEGGNIGMKLVVRFPGLNETTVWSKANIANLA